MFMHFTIRNKLSSTSSIFWPVAWPSYGAEVMTHQYWETYS
jgi:hypothetical protein